MELNQQLCQKTARLCRHIIGVHAQTFAIHYIIPIISRYVQDMWSTLFFMSVGIAAEHNKFVCVVSASCMLGCLTPSVTDILYLKTPNSNKSNYSHVFIFKQSIFITVFVSLTAHVSRLTLIFPISKKQPCWLHLALLSWKTHRMLSCADLACHCSGATLYTPLLLLAFANSHTNKGFEPLSY